MVLQSMTVQVAADHDRQVRASPVNINTPPCQQLREIFILRLGSSDQCGGILIEMSDTGEVTSSLTGRC